MMQYTVTTNAGVDVTAQWTGRAIEISAHPAGSLLIEWASTQERAISIFNRFIDKYTFKEQVSMDTNEQVGVTVAVEEPLSEVARIRLELAALFDAHKSFTGAYRNAAWREAQKKRYLLARDVFYEDVDMKMKTLFDTIDAQARELEALRAFTDKVTSSLDKDGKLPDGYYAYNVLWVLVTEANMLTKGKTS